MPTEQHPPRCSASRIEPEAPYDDLARIGLQPAEVGRLASGLRRRVIAHLLRWEQYGDALACADAALAVAPQLVSLYDDKAQALIGCGRPDEALQVLQDRRTRRESSTYWQLAGRAHLARGDAEAALEIARRLHAEAPDAIMAQAFLAEMLIAAGDDTEALAACRRLAELGPERRRLLLAMLALYRRRGDLVSASAYAVRIERSAGEEAPLPAATLRRLHDYYRASGEEHRAREVAQALEQLHAADLATLSDALGGYAAEAPASAPPAEAAPPDDSLSEAPAEPLPHTRITVDEEEERLVRGAAREMFGFTELRPGQLEAMSAALRGRDVLAVMPTGGGKSLCYQLPAFLDRAGVTLVISPLIALMKDQIESLPPGLRPQAITINSALDGDSLRQAIADVSAGRYRLVYAAPERLRQPPFLHALRRAGVNRLVVDEAHCISVWGHDFRPDYLFIGRARRDLGDPPVLAMTATAPTRVRQDIARRMARDAGASDDEMIVVATEPCRPNLRLESIAVSDHDERLRRLVALCHDIDGSGIVYADTRRRCEEIAAMLRGQGLDACHYHAGIEDPEERAAVQDAFMTGQVRIMVATIAFGMGIDKANIRFVIHYQLPNALESYYQEAGRAGRDGQPARCILLHAPSDRATLTRRFRREAITIETLRVAYASVRRQVHGGPFGRVSLDDVARDAEIEPVAARVAVSMLEEAGLLRRHYDLPRAATLRLRSRSGAPVPGQEGARLAELLAPSRGAAGESLTLDPLALAPQCGLDPRDWEMRTLEWAEAGWLSYRPAGRDPLIELLPLGRDDAGPATGAILDRYMTVQMQRIEEIAAYARTRRCRHEYLSRYLGGSPGAGETRCRSCDNCAPDHGAAAARRSEALPGEAEQLAIVLRCLGEFRHGCGPVTLRRMLRAEREAMADRRPSEYRGALAFRSRQAVKAMISALLTAGLLSARTLDHGGKVLEVTTAGRQALAEDGALARLTATKAPPAVGASEMPDAALSEADAALFERLRRWRSAVAGEAGLPPYIIAHDRVLRLIAAARPATAEGLDAIHGIGRSKVERYGEAILAIVRGE